MYGSPDESGFRQVLKKIFTTQDVELIFVQTQRLIQEGKPMYLHHC